MAKNLPAILQSARHHLTVEICENQTRDSRRRSGPFDARAWERSSELAWLLNISDPTDHVVYLRCSIFDDQMSAEMDKASLSIPVILEKAHGVRSPPLLPRPP